MLCLDRGCRQNLSPCQNFKNPFNKILCLGTLWREISISWWNFSQNLRDLNSVYKFLLNRRYLQISFLSCVLSISFFSPFSLLLPSEYHTIFGQIIELSSHISWCPTPPSPSFHGSLHASMASSSPWSPSWLHLSHLENQPLCHRLNPRHHRCSGHT